jgi:deoxyguanosine kinase
MSQPLYIAIEGPIGVGKSTLAQLLQEKLNARRIMEIVEENPFLADFYSDRDRFAFQTQIFFLMSRFKQQRLLLQPDLFKPNLITDYHLLKDRLFAQLTLNGEELALYQTIYRALEDQILKPDVIIFLNANQKTLLERIRRRGRPFEANFDESYLLALSETYQDFFATYDETPLLSLDTSQLNVPASAEVVDEIYHQVMSLANSRKKTVNAAG